jgi:uracil-DNA glycosylase
MWESFAEECRRCTRCKGDGLLDPNAFPIMMKNPPGSTDILFILEAPNKDDTYNPKKRYLTVEPDADPSGRFSHDLFVNELQFPIEDLFVTNSVLCLPAHKKGEYPVTSLQQSNCEAILRRMIDVFNPLVVCPVGAKALVATSRLNEHGYKKMATSVAKPSSWYGRTLFPLYHTSGQARNPRNGRPECMQRADWRSLRAVWRRLKAQQEPSPEWR